MFLNNLLNIIGSGIGAVAGYFYWQQIGCISGTCAITSDPLNSTLFGAVMGGLIPGLFKKHNKISGNDFRRNDTIR